MAGLTPAELSGVRLPPNPMATPKVPAVPRMCKTCPFHPSGLGHARDHEDFPGIVAGVAMGFPFYCHVTALLSPLTTLNAGGDPDPVPQPHFRHCAGAAAFRRGELAIPPLPGG